LQPAGSGRSYRNALRTSAVHLLESGAEVNLIRGWLGHASLNTTHRYAKITMRMKTEAMAQCSSTGSSKLTPWNNGASLLSWLTSL
jgi:integrase/recombinase XerD